MNHSTQPFILVVDDNATNLAILSQTLKAAGYKIRLAVDGVDALAQVDRHRPEVILLDIEMPNLNGFETCKRLQANPDTQRIPVIFMTALDDTANKVKGLSLGAVDYITKPFAEAEVLARINIHWRLKRLTDSLEEQVTERTQALQQAQIQLIQQEKLSILGQLVAGVAHEINNPTSCIVGNVSAARHYLEDLFHLLDLYRETFPQPGDEIEEELETLNLDFVREDLNKLIRAMQDGGDRIKNISKSLCTFYRSDSDSKQFFNLHECLDSTLLILRHRLKANEARKEIEVVKNYRQLPEVEGFPSQLNQVFMNLFANAIDAIDEKAQTPAIAASPHEEGERCDRIIIQTDLKDRQIEIAISDSGVGMSQEVQKHIFEQGFTTKTIGKGTGLGLAIAREIVVGKHGGTLNIHSQPGQGTTFTICIPQI